ncbi:hypothetical protein EDD15DRAFT_2327866, partial [Pisolithus albus]
MLLVALSIPHLIPFVSTSLVNNDHVEKVNQILRLRVFSNISNPPTAPMINSQLITTTWHCWPAHSLVRIAPKAYVELGGHEG